MKKTLIFIHIPKTAGTTLARIFKENYFLWPKKQVYMAHPALKEQALLAMAQKDRNTIRLVHGHVSYGFHKLLSREVCYVTYLRDPVKRVLSFYNFIHADSRHYLHKPVAGARMGFREFLDSGLTHELDNLQVRMLAGDEKEAPIGGISDEYLERAKANIEASFPVVGISEYFDESLLLMRSSWKWNFFPFYVRGKVSARPQLRMNDLDSETAAHALALNQWDQKLYEWAKVRLERQMQEAGPLFAARVSRFQYWNKWFQRIMACLPIYKKDSE